MLFDLDGYRSRFAFTDPIIPNECKGNLLISGASVGGEIQVALESGYSKVTATEVLGIYCDICRDRFRGNDQVFIAHYDGGLLPFSENSFDTVMTCHIIEHTSDPEKYLLEHLRVLRTGGHIFLEFPTRFHYKELHTGVPSVEWLPIRLRSFVIKMLVSDISPLSRKAKTHYRTIKKTLSPVSWLQIRSWLSKNDAKTRLIALERPARGIVRLVLEKI